MKIKILLINGG